jgi:hypothetical protein
MKKPNLSGGGLVKRVLLRKAKALRWKQSKGYLMKSQTLGESSVKKSIQKSQSKRLLGEAPVCLYGESDLNFRTWGIACEVSSSPKSPTDGESLVKGFLLKRENLFVEAQYGGSLMKSQTLAGAA